MRIIAGYYKGLRLCSFNADFIRPMTDRVKSSVFSSLYSKGGVENKRVLDLFSGTGNLALEALSRGAGEVYVVDSHKKAVSIIKKNLEILKIPSRLKKSALKSTTAFKGGNFKPNLRQNGVKLPNFLKIFKKDVFHFLTTYKGESFDLIFASPPFKEYLGERILKALSVSQASGKSTTLVLEISSQEKAPEETSFYHILLKKKFGDKQILFYSFSNR